jgi:carboxylate-amine ligase
VSAPQSPSADAVRRAFDERKPWTVGIEEELMLLDPDSGDLAPVASGVLERTSPDPRFKLELPAAQLEIATEPADTVSQLGEQLSAARRDLARAADGTARIASAGLHPFASPEGELNSGKRYDATAAEYGRTARRQLVFALQVHVAPGSADRALGVYNALRSYLPELAALAANAPYHDGADTGLASARPQIAGLLPRQGVPPALDSWEAYAESLAWGARSGTFSESSAWWWELRPHPRWGTLELRVPDAQTTVAESCAVAAVSHCLAAWLGDRADAGDLPPTIESWRISENRWRAARGGVEGRLARLDDGTPIATRERLSSLIEELAPTAQRLGCANELAGALELVKENGAICQRAVAREAGIRGLVDWLAERFLA